MDQSKIPDNLYYTKDHEWVRFEGPNAVIGISDHAQHALGDVTYVDLPPKGKALVQGGELGAVESAKAASDVFSPVSGKVAETNAILEDDPGRINSDPYGEGWLCKLSSVNASEQKNLLTAAQYRELLERES